MRTEGEQQREESPVPSLPQLYVYELGSFGGISLLLAEQLKRLPSKMLMVAASVMFEGMLPLSRLPCSESEELFESDGHASLHSPEKRL